MQPLEGVEAKMRAELNVGLVIRHTSVVPTTHPAIRRKPGITDKSWKQWMPGHAEKNICRLGNRQVPKSLFRFTVRCEKASVSELQ